MEATIEPSMASLSLYSSNSNHQTQEQQFPPSMLRHWRPSAHRNLINQWKKLFDRTQQWRSSVSSSKTHTNSLVNTYLSSRYVDRMELGVLSDMPNIRKKARCKLVKQQELQVNKFLSSYKSMVSHIVDMTNASRSMRCYLKAASGSPLIGFSCIPTNSSDTGDGGGALVSTFLPISAFETLAQELLEMFKQELLLKRLLVVEFLSVTCLKLEQYNQLSWTDELYPGEAEDLSTCNVYSKETAEPCLLKLNGRRTESAHVESDKHRNREILEAYLTTWDSEVNIDTYRMEEIFATVEEELGTSFAKKSSS